MKISLDCPFKHTWEKMSFLKYLWVEFVLLRFSVSVKVYQMALHCCYYLEIHIMFIQLGNGPLPSSRTLQYTTTKSTPLTMYSYIKKNPHSEQCSAFRKISWVCVIKRFVNRVFRSLKNCV